MQPIRIRFVDGCNTEPFLRLLSLSHIDTHNYEEIWAGLMRLRWCLVLALSFLLMTSTALADDDGDDDDDDDEEEKEKEGEEEENDGC